MKTVRRLLPVVFSLALAASPAFGAAISFVPGPFIVDPTAIPGTSVGPFGAGFIDFTSLAIASNSGNGLGGLAGAGVFSEGGVANFFTFRDTTGAIIPATTSGLGLEYDLYALFDGDGVVVNNALPGVDGALGLLDEVGEEAGGVTLGHRLERWATGSLAEVFRADSPLPLDRGLLVVGLADLSDPEVRSVAQLAALAVLWDAVRADLSPKLVVVDEIHRLPNLFETLRGIIDDRRAAAARRGQFLLLGSASIDLMSQASETLAGRVAYVELAGIDALEFAARRGGLRRSWLRGGFPDSVLARSDRDSFAWRRDFLRSYLERDVPMFAPRMPAQTIGRLVGTELHVRQATLRRFLFEPSTRNAVADKHEGDLGLIF